MEIQEMTNSQLMEQFRVYREVYYKNLPELVRRILGKKVRQKDVESIWENIEKYIDVEEIETCLLELIIDFMGRNFIIEKLKKLRNAYLSTLYIAKLGDLSEEEAQELIVSQKSKTREYAAKYLNREIALEKILYEKGKKVVKNLLERLGKLSKEEAEKLILSDDIDIKEYACDYDLSKKIILQVIVEEENDSIANKLLSKLDTLTKQEAKQLLEAKVDKVRLFAATYADREDLLKQVLVEKDDEILKNMLMHIERAGKLTKEEAKFLFQSESSFVKKFVVTVLSRESLLKQFSVEKDEGVIKALWKQLNVLTDKEAQMLMKAKSLVVKRIASQYVSVKFAKSCLFAIEKICRDDEIALVSNLLAIVGCLSQKEAEILTLSENWKVREYSAKFLNKEVAFERILIEQDGDVVKALLEQIENLSEDEANQMMGAIHIYARKYACNFLNKENVLHYFFLEYNNAPQLHLGMIEKLFERLVYLTTVKGQKLTLRELEELFGVNYPDVRIYAVQYFSRETAFRIVYYGKEENEDVIHCLLKKISSLTEEEANQLMECENISVKIYASKYLSKMSALEYFLEEKEGPVKKALAKRMKDKKRE